MSCAHPDPKKLQWLFCRQCGQWSNGERVGAADESELRRQLEIAVGKPVHLVAFEAGTCGAAAPLLDESQLPCCLPLGHEGEHEDVNGLQWAEWSAE